MIGPPMLQLTLPLVAVFALSLLLPGQALGQAEGLSLPNQPTLRPPAPGEGGDSVLPTGYKGVVWAASPEIVQAIRGKGMEVQITTNPHIKYLIEIPPPGEMETEVVKWKFWDARLVEVHIHYEGPFTRLEGKELVHKFQRKYGEGKHEVRKGRKHHTFEEEVLQEWWTWEDPFSIQVLRRNVDENGWTALRHSRVLEMSRKVQEERERAETRTERVKDIELD